MVQFAVGRDAALRGPRPRSADGNPSTRLGHFIAPLNAARLSQRDDPTARTQTVPLPAGTEATPSPPLGCSVRCWTLDFRCSVVAKSPRRARQDGKIGRA